MNVRFGIFVAAPALLFTLTIVGTTMAGSPDTLDHFLQSPPRWSVGSVDTGYNPDNLHEYINGGAERYLGYGFRELRVREYLSAYCPFRIMVEIYRMDSPANAFGIFSSDRAGGELAPGIGRDAVINPWLLQFWQDRYFVRIQDAMASGAVRDTLLEFGRLISAVLPRDEDTSLPGIVSELPRQGLVETSLCYFHTHNSLNSFVYLGERNTLGLGPEVEAVTAEYELPGGAAYGRLVLVRYPDEKSAREAFRRFAETRTDHPALALKNLSRLAVRGQYLLLLFNVSDDGWSDRMESAVWDVFGR